MKKIVVITKLETSTNTKTTSTEVLALFLVEYERSYPSEATET